ncbi:hypothetical protein [Jannaschia formosa]|nr:hypothetical protein [Jannaschia formosa]
MRCATTLRLATAAGRLNAMRRGRGTGTRADIEALAEAVEIEEISP